MSDLARIAGLLLAGLTLLDLFLTVLYARSGSGFIAWHLYRANWRLFRFVSRPLGEGRPIVLSFAGPIGLVLIAAAWFLLIVLGFALIYWPELGSGLTKSVGSTPRDFVTAVYYSGYCMTTLGIGDISPSSGGLRLLTVIQAAVGFSFFTLTLTYFLSVYSALQRRNTFASILHHKTSGTGDAGQIILSIATGGSVSSASQDLSDLSSRAADLLESHTFYPVLHYFHFRHLRYAVPRMVLIQMDTASLVRTLPFPGEEKLQASASQLETATCDLLKRMAEVFLTHHRLESFQPEAKERERWRGHYRQIADELRKKRVELPLGTEEEERYIDLRRRWHPYVAALSASLGYDLDEIVPSRSGNATE